MDLPALRTPAGVAALTAATDLAGGDPLASAAAALRVGRRATRARRRRAHPGRPYAGQAAGKFGARRPSGLFFTRAGLEQATRSVVAGRRARRPLAGRRAHPGRPRLWHRLRRDRRRPGGNRGRRCRDRRDHRGGRRRQRRRGRGRRPLPGGTRRCATAFETGGVRRGVLRSGAAVDRWPPEVLRPTRPIRRRGTSWPRSADSADDHGWR